ncbi:MAG: tetratricopeptide repeat protein [Anaerolineaceae bacterium]|nr:tetratricopeptide repeat protein [Anaerolineaceae bacterium]
MSSTRSSKPCCLWPGCGWLALIFTIVTVGYSVTRSIIDRNQYTRGHQAYQQADCTAAISHFDNIIQGVQLVDTGNYRALAIQEKSECLLFQVAVDQQQAGNFSATLIGYANFISEYGSSVLADIARDRIASLFEQAGPAALASREACDRLDSFVAGDLFPQKDKNVPLFHFACGQIYETAKDQQKSFTMYTSFLTEYPDHTLANEAEASLLTNPVACQKSDSLLKNSAIADRTDFMPTLYYNCGQAYDEQGEYSKAFEIYRVFLMTYPQHSLANKVETYLLANPAVCEKHWMLKYTVIAKRKEFMPSLYYSCGQSYEEDRDWAKAIKMYETFLADYPGHSLAEDVEAALARTIVAQARTAGAGNMPEPSRSGSTSSEITEVVIQNDSPQRLRIVFSGPESLVEELEACSSCTTYTLVGPTFCPAKGPTGRYTLKPGQYDVVVEAISGSEVTPWSGNWALVSGDEYYNCFFIVHTYITR